MSSEIALFFNSEFFSIIILPLLIFVARALDVGLGTIRVIFISRGFKYLAPAIGFVEILIWLFAIGTLVKNIDNFLYVFAYAGGFAAGTFIGLQIEEKLSLGMVLIQVFTKKFAQEIIQELEADGFKVTSIDAQGVKGSVKMIFIVTARNNVKKITEIVEKFNPGAFYSIEDVRTAHEAIRAGGKKTFGDYIKIFPAFKKGK